MAKVALAVAMPCAVVTSWTGVPAGGPGEEQTCPSHLDVAVSGTSAPGNWSHAPRLERLPLRGFGVSDGQPQNNAILRPSESKGPGTHRQATWRFTGHVPEGRWLYCSYGDALYTIHRRLADDVQQCSIAYDQAKGRDPIFRSLVCR